MNEETQLEAWMKENLVTGTVLKPLDNPADADMIRNLRQAYSDTGEIITGTWRPYEISEVQDSSPADWSAMWANIWLNLRYSAPGRQYYGGMSLTANYGGNTVSFNLPIAVVQGAGVSKQSGFGGGYDSNTNQTLVVKFGNDFTDFTLYLNGVDATESIEITTIGVHIYYQIS